MVDNFHNEPLSRNFKRWSCDLHLYAEGELDFRNVKLKNLKMRRRKKRPRSKIYGVFNFFCFLSWKLFYTENSAVWLSLPYPCWLLNNSFRDRRFTHFSSSHCTKTVTAANDSRPVIQLL